MLNDTKQTGPARDLMLELTQDGVGEILTMSVSRYNPLPGDKTAYEGYGKDGPYRLDIPPCSIKDFEQARRSILEYIDRAKVIHVQKLVDQNNDILWTTFQ